MNKSKAYTWVFVIVFVIPGLLLSYLMSGFQWYVVYHGWEGFFAYEIREVEKTLIAPGLATYLLILFFFWTSFIFPFIRIKAGDETAVVSVLVMSLPTYILLIYVAVPPKDYSILPNATPHLGFCMLAFGFIIGRLYGQIIWYLLDGAFFKGDIIGAISGCILSGLFFGNPFILLAVFNIALFTSLGYKIGKPLERMKLEYEQKIEIYKLRYEQLKREGYERDEELEEMLK